MDDQNAKDVRWDRVRDARQKIARGHYDHPRVLREVADRVRRQLTQRDLWEAGGCTAYATDE